jgi:hypothetical protein
VIYHAGRKLGGHVELRGDEAGPVAVKLVPLGAMVGRVLDADGQPIAGAEVNSSFTSNAGNEMERLLRQQRPLARTDAGGRFRLDGIIPGQKLTLYFRKGQSTLAGQPRMSPKEVAARAVLDLGDMRTKPNGE